MPGQVQFEGDELGRTTTYSAQKPLLIRWAMQLSGGLIKNEKEAQIALIGLAGILLAASVFVLMSGPDANEEPPPRDPSDYAS